jgi:histidinol-phosphatase (PHP family)
LIADYHIHTGLCGHARGTVEELVESAIEKGFEQVGIADHSPLLYAETPFLAMSRDELPGYVGSVLEAKERYRGRIEVRLGIEADYHAPTQEERVAMLREYPFDYIIGSVHILGDWIFDSPHELERYDEIDLDEFYMEYLDEVADMVASGVYDIVGHPDLAKKFDKRPTVDLAPRYREILLSMKERGVCYEVNTSGLRWPVREMYPEPAFVRLASGLGVPVTLGSDAHCPEDVGRDFDRAVDLIKGAGYTEVATFENRSMRLVEFTPGSAQG